MTQPGNLSIPQLGIGANEAAERFEQLQGKLVPMWRSMRTMTSDERTVVVVPSQTSEFDVKGAEMQGYEERFLFLLLLLRQPRVRLIYTKIFQPWTTRWRRSLACATSNPGSVRSWSS